MKSVLTLLLALSITWSAFAQVTMYEHANYQGQSKKFDIGEVSKLEPKNTSIWAGFGFGCTDICNDIISSVKVPLGWKVVVWEHINFTGRSLTLTADCPFLGDFNDIISSFKVERTRPAPAPAPCEVYMTLKNGFSTQVHVFFYEWPAGTSFDWCTVRIDGGTLNPGQTVRRFIPLNKTLVYGFYENSQSCLMNYEKARGSIYRSGIGCGENYLTVGQ